MSDDTLKTPMNNEDQGRPCFLPADIKWEALPEAVRAAIHEIVMPLYRVYVLENADPLQRSTGMSLVFLTTLEVIECVGNSRALFAHCSSDEESKARQQQIDRHLRLVGAKTKCTELLLRLEAWREKALVRHLNNMPAFRE